MFHNGPQPLYRAAMPEPNRGRPEESDAGHVPMSEEFDRAKWTLPPLGLVAIVLAVIAVIVGIVAYLARPKPGATGRIEQAYAVALPGDSVLTTMTVTVVNTGGKPLWIRNIKAQLKTDQGEYRDDAASPTDFERYFSAYPDLRDHSIRPLEVETKIEPGAQERGTVIVSFPVTLDNFNNRKSLSVIIERYDQGPLVITR
jgi:hypothetical protein